MKKLICLVLAFVLLLCSMSLPVGAAGETFSDVPAGAWYYSAVAYAAEKGLMSGVGEGKFNPNGKVTRAQIAQALHNREGRPSVAGLANPFTDVGGQWFATAVIWCKANGIVSGSSATSFNPTGQVTRQDLCAMVYRYYTNYLGTKNPEMNSDSEMSAKFSDWGAQANYSTDALKWAAKTGFMQGSNGKLNPKGTATRAELAQFLNNFETKVLKTDPDTPGPAPTTSPIPTSTPKPTICPSPSPTDKPTLPPVPTMSPQPTIYPEGEYRVGIDIPAGEYSFTPSTDRYPGYYCVYSDTTKKDIVHNDIFRGKAYYMVENGQLLRVSRATFELISSTYPNPTPSSKPTESPKPTPRPDEEKKWSVQDAQNLSKCLSAAADQVNLANKYALTAFGRGDATVRTANLKLSITATQGAMVNYKAALDLLNSRVELSYTGGGSLNEDVQNIYDELSSLSSLSTDIKDIDESSSELASTLQSVLAKQVRALNAASQLLAHFL